MTFLLTFAGQANAHVKWFCAFNVAGEPRGLESVLCPDFEWLVALALLVLTSGCLLEGTFLGRAALRALDAVTALLRHHTEFVIRAVGVFFLGSLWWMGGVILTPELKTSSPVIPWIQLAMACGLLWRRTLPLTGLGIVVLFALAMREYGVFHLADYPVFLGLAAYLALVSAGRNLWNFSPLDVLRWAAAVTLMWASIEKWAYPQWSFPLFIDHPTITMGFDGEFVMRAAGVVEFALAFALLWTPLVRRAAALVLAGTFISATFEFGMIDVVGHAPIIAVLLAVAAEDASTGWRRRYVALAPVGFGAALAGFLVVYYVAHAALFGTQVI